MSKATRRADATPRDFAPREAREAAEEAPDLATLDGGLLPRPAPPSRITDMQHWIDLCA